LRIAGKYGLARAGLSRRSARQELHYIRDMPGICMDLSYRVLLVQQLDGLPMPLFQFLWRSTRGSHDPQVYLKTKLNNS